MFSDNFRGNAQIVLKSEELEVNKPSILPLPPNWLAYPRYPTPKKASQTKKNTREWGRGEAGRRTNWNVFFLGFCSRPIFHMSRTSYREILVKRTSVTRGYLHGKWVRFGIWAEKTSTMATTTTWSTVSHDSGEFATCVLVLFTTLPLKVSFQEHLNWATCLIS